MRRCVKRSVLSAAVGIVLAVPASALAASGGTSLTAGAGIGTGTTGSSATTVVPGDVNVTASGDGITLVSSASAILRHQLTFSGTAPRGDAGDTIEIDRLGHQTRWQWASTVQATVAGDGSFSAVWKTNHIGRFAIRALITQPPTATAAAALPTVTVTVYRVAIATQYGPGFYGRRTACGSKLTRSTIGVANRTLRCGTQVAIDYRGRTLIVPVIDRGPYANGADWDLTEATGRVLGIDGTARIGAVSLPQQP